MTPSSRPGWSGLRSLRQQLDIAMVSEDPIPPSSRQLAYDPQASEHPQRSADGRRGETRGPGEERVRGYGPVLECMMHAQRRADSTLVALDLPAILLEELDDLASRNDRAFGRFPSSLRKEPEPGFPVSLPRTRAEG